MDTNRTRPTDRINRLVHTNVEDLMGELDLLKSCLVYGFFDDRYRDSLIKELKARMEALSSLLNVI